VTLAAVLGARRSGVRLHVPSRGAKRRLVALAGERGRALAKDRAGGWRTAGARRRWSGWPALGLASRRTIECYDQATSGHERGQEHGRLHRRR
jgi:hypothetical protein